VLMMRAIAFGCTRSTGVPASLANGVVEPLDRRLVGALADRLPAIADRGEQLRPGAHPLPAGPAVNKH
jgi:hypothetical protein